MILYFTGSGNSKYCAEKLGQLLEDEVVNIADYLRENKCGNFHSDRPWVKCVHIYAAYIPLSVEKFIKESTFEGNNDFYFIATLGGNEKGGSIAPKILEPLCNVIGKNYMGTAHISMPRNYIMLFSMPSEDECKEKLDSTDAVLPKYAEIIKNGSTMPPHKINKFEYITVKPFIGLYYKLLLSDKKFTVDDKCIGCGLCERKCPLGNINMVNGKPQWNGNCTHCTACINYCPVTAIQYGNKTQTKNRYYLEQYR